jgi:hypothetical protein
MHSLPRLAAWGPHVVIDIGRALFLHCDAMENMAANGTAGSGRELPLAAGFPYVYAPLPFASAHFFDPFRTDTR